MRDTKFFQLFLAIRCLSAFCLERSFWCRFASLRTRVLKDHQISKVSIDLAKHKKNIFTFIINYGILGEYGWKQ